MPPDIAQTLSRYPNDAQTQLLAIRALIFATATQENITDLSETLKWGEPSYTCKSGSTIRMDWKAKTPDVVYVFFHCQTKLIDTFRELFSGELVFEGKRAIVLSLNHAVPTGILSQCISMALRYHDIKHLPRLGYASQP